ncbi:MAG: MFS transporter [Candidatus Hermodarchaeota archaeon]
MTDVEEGQVASTDDVRQRRPSSRQFLGLSGNLWRLALVTGIAQFSFSLWGWEFSIFLYTIVELWQIGVIYSTGTLAMLIGYLMSGAVADIVGRKKAMVLSFIPMIIGLFSLAYFPFWPLIPIAYGVLQFGWSFILIITRAVPADEIAADGGKDAARRFTMVLLPAFLVDGLSPMLGAFLLGRGFTPQNLHVIAAVGSVIACLATIVFVRESLSDRIIEKAKSGPIISFRQLGPNFWKLAGGMLGFYFFFNAALAYFGLLVTEGWGISEEVYGYSWSAFSLTSVLLMHTISGLADRNVKRALLFGVIANGLMIISFSLLSGIPALILLNIMWAMPVVLWIGAERALVINGVGEEVKGRALGTYQFAMSSTNLVAAPFGALLTTMAGGFRQMWTICGVAALGTVVLTAAGLSRIRLEGQTQMSSENEDGLESRAD